MESAKSFEFVVMGYTQENENKYNLIIPTPIKLFVLSYYPKIIDHKGKFIASNAGSCIEILFIHRISMCKT